MDLIDERSGYLIKRYICYIVLTDSYKYVDNCTEWFKYGMTAKIVKLGKAFTNLMHRCQIVKRVNWIYNDTSLKQ